MKKQILNLGKALNKEEQQKINGKNGCDIAPPGCPCFVPPNHPCLGTGGGSGGGTSTGWCFGQPDPVPCNAPCNDGSIPICR